jgi:hypothetical protein
LHAEFLTQRREEAKAQRDFISVFAGGDQGSKFHSSVCSFLFSSAGFAVQRPRDGGQFIFNFWQNPAGRGL